MHLTKNLCVNILGFLACMGSQKIHRKHGRTSNVIKDKTVRLWDTASKSCLKKFSHSDYGE